MFKAFSYRHIFVRSDVRLQFLFIYLDHRILLHIIICCDRLVKMVTTEVTQRCSSRLLNVVTSTVPLM